MQRLALILAICCCSGTAVAQYTASGDDSEVTPAPLALPTQRPDERRAAKPLTSELFGRPVEFGLRYEIGAERRHNFDLDSRRQNDREVLDYELKFDARLRASDSVTLFLQGIGLGDRRKSLRDGSARIERSFERGQTWLQVEGLRGLPLSVQAGRVALIERRSWWWDEDLDAVRLLFTPRNWRVETGLARELARISSSASDIDPDAKGLTRWYGNASVRWAQRHTLEAFWLVANDHSGAAPSGALFAPDSEDPVDAKLNWFGLRSHGELRFESKHRLIYRADAALVRGEESRTSFAETAAGPLIAGATSTRPVRGYAWDLGAQWILPGAARPTFSLGVAKGSGGADDGTQDHNFRQTGLQENKSRVGGVKRMRYYGELLDPELSNLRIVSAGFGLRFLGKNSVELLLHQYRQEQASTRLAGSRLSVDPAGLNRDIGSEIDFFIALREWRHVEVTLNLSRFQPGAAFAADRRDPAYSAELGVALIF